MNSVASPHLTQGPTLSSLVPPSALSAQGQSMTQAHSSSSPVSSPTPATTPPTPDSPANSKTGKPSSASAEVKNVCINCRTETTPLWRRDSAGNTICNACGLHLRLHGVMRQVSDKQLAGKTVIRRRNRTSNAAATASAAAAAAAAGGGGGSARGAKGRRQSHSHPPRPKKEQQPPAIINLGDLPAAPLATVAAAPTLSPSHNQLHPSLATPVQQHQQLLPSIRTFSSISHSFPTHLPKPASLHHTTAHNQQQYPTFSPDEHKPFAPLKLTQNTWPSQPHLHLPQLTQQQHLQNQHLPVLGFAPLSGALSSGSSAAITPMSTTVSSSSSPEFDGVDALMILANASQALEDGYQ